MARPNGVCAARPASSSERRRGGRDQPAQASQSLRPQFPATTSERSHADRMAGDDPAAATQGMTGPLDCAVAEAPSFNGVADPEASRTGARATRSGDRLHLDIKKLGRISGFYGHRITGDRSKSREGAGWDFVHVAIDDASRITYPEVLPDETGDCDRVHASGSGPVPHPRHPSAPNPDRQRLGLPQSSFRSGHHGAARPAQTHSTLPSANERQGRALHPTLLREWPHAVAYLTSEARAKALSHWLRRYNKLRPTTVSTDSHPSVGYDPG